MPRSGSSSQTNPSTGAVSTPAAAVIGIRELRADVAALIRRAGAGEQMIITVTGRPVAHLGPLGAVDGSIEGRVRLEDLIARGQVVAPRRTGSHLPRDPVPVWHGSRIDKLLNEIR